MKYAFTVVMALAVAFSSNAIAGNNGAGNGNCPPGWEKAGKECVAPIPVPVPDEPGVNPTQTQVAIGGNANSSASASSSVKDSGNSSSTAFGGSAAGGSIKDSGNASIGDTSNTNLNLTDIGDVGSNSKASVGNVGSDSKSSVGDIALSNGSNSGGNKLNNESASSSGAFSGGNTQANSTSNDGSGNSEVKVDASDRSTTTFTSQTLLLPTIQNAAPALVANPALIVDRSSCGPRMEKVQTNVTGTYVGLIKKSRIDLGTDDEIVPASEPYRYWTSPSGSQHVFGHQIVTYASVVGAAGSRSAGLGGGETGGNWGQGGMSSGSSMQRNVLRVQLQECEIPFVARETVVLMQN